MYNAWTVKAIVSKTEKNERKRTEREDGGRESVVYAHNCFLFATIDGHWLVDITT